jgi:N-acetylglucosamine-6-phosphate deacetylase
MKIRGRHYLTGDACEIAYDGTIQAMTALDQGDDADVWLAPGLIDIQVNGYQGYNFCSATVTPEEVTQAAQRLADAGVTGFCPTVTTGSPAAMEASVRAIAAACAAGPIARQRILGIHLEGPYISPFDGPRGAHPREHARNPDWEEFTRLQDAAGGKIGIVTLAPELPGGLEFIARASSAGVVVALGHHAATREQIRAAVNAGATLSTHLGNGSHSELPRHNNYIWEQLAHDGLLASIIVDGHHLPPPVVKCFYRAKGMSRTILVSDAIAAAGLPVGPYRFMGTDAEVCADGSVRLKGTPYLAGSTLKLCDAIPNVMAFAGASFADAITMATTNPARLLGVERERGRLCVGMRADLAVFRAEGGVYRLVKTIAGGEVCFEA